MLLLRVNITKLTAKRQQWNPIKYNLFQSDSGANFAVTGYLGVERRGASYCL